MEYGERLGTAKDEYIPVRFLHCNEVGIFASQPIKHCSTCGDYGYMLLVRFLKPSSHECLVSPETMRGNESDRPHKDIPCPDCNVECND